MRCPEEFTLAVYADGELASHESADVAAHIEVCGSCRERVELLAAESVWLRTSLAGPVGEQVDGQEAAVIGATRSTRARSGGLWPLTVSVAVAAALPVVYSSVLPSGLPPSLGWLDPSGLQGQLMLLAETLFYAIGNGPSLVTSIAAAAATTVLGALALCGVAALVRRSPKLSSAGLVGALVLCVTTPGQAIDLRHVEHGVVNVDPGEVIDDTLVVFAQSVHIDGTVNGSVIAFGMEVDVGGTVLGNVTVFTRRLDIDGVVEGDVLAFAQSLSLRGRIGGDLWAFNESTTQDEENQIGGNATLFAGDGGIDGSVGRDLTMFGGILTVGGEVGRGVRFRGNQIVVRAPAQIGGDLSAVVRSEEMAEIDPAAVILGDRSIELQEREERPAFTAWTVVWQVLRVVSGFLVGLILFWALPPLARVDFGDGRVLLTSGGVGFLAVVAAPAAVLILAVTIVGLHLAFLTLLLWLIGIYLSKLMVAQFIGGSLLGRKPDGAATALGLLLGVVLVVAAVNLPFVGWLINFLLVLVGLGALLMGLYRLFRDWRSGTQAPQPAV